jgi:branched-chain amino acid transport system substrate-binding protein
LLHSCHGYLFTDFFDYGAPPTQRSKEFIEAYAKKTGKQEVNSFVALGADAYNVMVDAMNRCANPEDSVCINNAIKSTVNFEGVSGVLNIDKSGNSTRSAVIKVVQNAKAVYKATVNP